MGRIGNRFSYSFDNGGSMSGDFGPGGDDILKSYNPPAPGKMANGLNRAQPAAQSDSSVGMLGTPGKTGDVEQDRITDQTFQFGRAKLNENALNRKVQREGLDVERSRNNQNYELGKEQSATARFEANTDRNYKMGSLGEERYKTNANLQVENRKISTDAGLTMMKIGEDRAARKESLAFERQRLGTQQTEAYLDRRNRLKEIEQTGSEQRANTKLDNQGRVQAAQIDASSRIATQQLANQSNTYDGLTRAWGSMLSSFLN